MRWIYQDSQKQQEQPSLSLIMETWYHGLFQKLHLVNVCTWDTTIIKGEIERKRLPDV